MLVCLRIVVRECLKASVLEARRLARMRLVADVVSPQSGCCGLETPSVTGVGPECQSDDSLFHHQNTLFLE